MGKRVFNDPKINLAGQRYHPRKNALLHTLRELPARGHQARDVLVS